MTEAYDGRQVVGMDLHRRRSVLVRMTEDGRRLGTARISNSPAALREAIAGAGEAPRVVLEATYGWYWAADVLEAAGAEVHLAHPPRRQGVQLQEDPLTPPASPAGSPPPAPGGPAGPPSAASPAAADKGAAVGGGAAVGPVPVRGPAPVPAAAGGGALDPAVLGAGDGDDEVEPFDAEAYFNPCSGPPEGEDAWLARVASPVADEWLAARQPRAGAREVLAAGFTHGDREPGGRGFAAGGPLDTMEPGPVLAGFADDAIDGGLGSLSDDELIGLVGAGRRLASRAATARSSCARCPAREVGRRMLRDVVAALDEATGGAQVLAGHPVAVVQDELDAGREPGDDSSAVECEFAGLQDRG